MRKSNILGMAAAMGLLAASSSAVAESMRNFTFSLRPGERNIYRPSARADTAPSLIKPRSWHDPARKAAADLRQAKRCNRNFLQAVGGAYGRDWMVR